MALRLPHMCIVDDDVKLGPLRWATLEAVTVLAAAYLTVRNSNICLWVRATGSCFCRNGSQEDQ
jgi:hypothetical protein